MNDAHIEQIRREVLGQLGTSAAERVSHDLESRVAALEQAVATLVGGRAPGLGPSAPVRGLAHPSLQVLGAGGGDRCVMEPDKPCVQSQACRTFGH